MNTRLIALGLGAALTLVGCAHDDDMMHHEEGAYGHLGPQVVELYDVGHPGGMIELELTRDGAVYEAEADIRPDQVPGHVMAAAKERAGMGARVTGAEIEYGAAGRTYEVKFDHNGVGLEFVLDESGRILESERSLPRAEAPAAVITNAMNAIPGSFVSVEILELRDGSAVYHVKTQNGEGRYKAVLNASGEVLRAVREARAEIEIPLPREDGMR